MSRCPGQDSRKLTISYHKCPTCGYAVELFSDELRQRCPRCRTEVQKEQTPSCIQWCTAARRCIGPQRYDAIMKQMQEADGPGRPREGDGEETG